MFRSRYGNVYAGDKHWAGISVEGSDTYNWPTSSTYIANPPYFDGLTMTPNPTSDIIEAKPLAILGDSITTDHIRRPVRSRRTARPELSCKNIRLAAGTSTATAPAAATTMS